MSSLHANLAALITAIGGDIKSLLGAVDSLASGGILHFGDYPPNGSEVLWFNTQLGVLLAKYNDGDSTQWVENYGGMAGPTHVEFNSAIASLRGVPHIVTDNQPIVLAPINRGYLIEKPGGVIVVGDGNSGGALPYYGNDFIVMVANTSTVANVIFNKSNVKFRLVGTATEAVGMIYMAPCGTATLQVMSNNEVWFNGIGLTDVP